MARKTSDIALLLGSRGRGRSRNGLAKTMRGIWQAWFGRSQWSEDRRSRSVLVPGWIVAIVVLAAFAGGWFAGGRFGTPAEGKVGLNARAANAPGFVDEYQPLEDEAFLVAVYPNLSAAEGSSRAKGLADWLAANGLRKAQPYSAPAVGGGSLWTVAVYYGGEAEQQATLAKLKTLRDVPDPVFCSMQNSDPKWPARRRTR